jgi:hypothetical protein
MKRSGSGLISVFQGLTFGSRNIFWLLLQFLVVRVLMSLHTARFHGIIIENCMTQDILTGVYLYSCGDGEARINMLSISVNYSFSQKFLTNEEMPLKLLKISATNKISLPYFIDFKPHFYLLH